MISETVTLPDTPDSIKNLVLELQDEIVVLRESYEKETDILREQIRLLRSQLYGRKSEKVIPTDGPQPLPLFDLPEPEGLEQEPKEEIHIPGHTRKKGGRKPLPENLPRVEVVHDYSKVYCQPRAAGPYPDREIH